MKYEEELSELQEAYPSVVIWENEEGLWLLTESSVLTGLEMKATFLTIIPFSIALFPKSWGFWTTAISTEWIGPRHTNFPDGSICAFELKDGSWIPGDSIIDLLNLYSVWALRHLHLKVFGKWPGDQFVCHPYERLLELNDDEICGCGSADKLYVDCCKKEDKSSNQIEGAIHFWVHMSGGKLRMPPQSILEFIQSGY